ncbi:MAG: hypothetical protein V4659_12085 [Pseudomonadota bacterium]
MAEELSAAVPDEFEHNIHALAAVGRGRVRLAALDVAVALLTEALGAPRAGR